METAGTVASLSIINLRTGKEKTLPIYKHDSVNQASLKTLNVFLSKTLDWQQVKPLFEVDTHKQKAPHEFSSGVFSLFWDANVFRLKKGDQVIVEDEIDSINHDEVRFEYYHVQGLPWSVLTRETSPDSQYMAADARIRIIRSK